MMLAFPCLMNAQVKIGVLEPLNENEEVLINQNGSILEFVDNCESNVPEDCDNQKGIILPLVGEPPLSTEDLSTDPVSDADNGTFVLDAADGKAKVRVDDAWMNLSYAPAKLQELRSDGPYEDIGGGVIIADDEALASAPLAKGVLVLESTDKAMVLPKVYKPDETIDNPYPGMMCYDIYSKSLMVYDGLYWNTWKKKQ